MDRLRRNEPVREYGRYGFQTINGLLENDPSFGFDGKPLNGMPLQTLWLYGSFRAPESGNYYAALKHMNPTSSLKLMFYKAEPDDDFRGVKEASRSYQGGCYNLPVDGRVGLWDYVSGPNDQFFTLNVDAGGNTHYRERGLIDVEGSQLGNVMQSVVLDSRSPMTYTSRCLRAHGEAMGEEVEGFFFTDVHYLGAGQDWLVSDFFHGVQGIWVVFVTEYDDGTWDIGNLFWGLGGFASGMIQSSDGQNLATTSLRAEVDYDEHDFVDEARFILADDEVWRFGYRRPNGTPKMPVMKVAGSPNWNEGVVTRVGDDRRWAKAEAWMEIYPSTLDKLLSGEAPPE